jgi:hypothetical protein
MDKAPIRDNVLGSDIGALSGNRYSGLISRLRLPGPFTRHIGAGLSPIPALWGLAPASY